MDVKELRIGNLVKDDECIIVIVEALSGDNALVNGYGENEVLFSKKGYPNVLFESEIYPIKLTEEILLKCWFKYESNHDWYELNVNNITLSINCDGEAYYYDDEEFMWVHILKTTEYLHHLKNLYFALTGQELDISQLINN